MARNRTFRVFVSSTFEDFQIEREHLRERIWPELENYCRLRGATFEATDLRWGIPANSAEELDIVSICLDEVERCKRLSPRPNFIALIGNRYGWRPLPVTVQKKLYDTLPAETKEIISEHYKLDENAVPIVYLINKEKLKSPAYENELLLKIRDSLKNVTPTPEIEDCFFKSATHLEIENGIFKPNIENIEDHFFVCNRDIEELSGDVDAANLSSFGKKFIDLMSDDKTKHDTEAAAWIGKLRAQIADKLENNSGQIKSYRTSLQELSNDVTPEYIQQMCLDIELWLKKMIEEELAVLNSLDPREVERIEHENFKELRNKTFGGREKLIDELKQACNVSTAQNIICIHGEGGSGKSALMAKFIDEIENFHPGAAVVYRFIGATPNSVELNSLLEGIVDEVNIKCDKPAEVKRVTRDEHVTSFNDLLTADFNKQVFIFIDALDQLNNTENAHTLNWLPQKITGNITLVVSVLNGSIESALRKIYPDINYYDISPGKVELQTGEAEAMLNSLLGKAPKRTLQAGQKKYILDSFNKNPLLLFLKLAAENARHWHSYDSIDFIEKKRLGLKSSAEEQIELLFERLSLEENHGPAFVQHILSLIALSREGVSQKEITDILWMDEDYRKEFDRRKHSNQPDVEQLPPIIWSRFFFEIEPFLMERTAGGAIVFDFFHRLFKVVVKSRIDESLALTIHRLLSKYFSDEKLHPVRFIKNDGSVVYNRRKLIELPYHQTDGKEIDNAYKTLTDFVFVDSKVKIGKSFQLLEDYQSALSIDVESKNKLLPLLVKAYRTEVNFIAHHPDALFQSMYNNCWWYDHPRADEFYESVSNDNEQCDDKLYRLMESWESTNSALNPGFRWLKSLQPPPVLLDGPQQSVLRGLSSPVIFVKYSPGDKKVIAICNRGELIIWDAATQNIEQFIPLAEEKSFMFKPNSKSRFGSDTEIMSDKGGVLADHPGFEYWAWSGVTSSDGKLVLGGSFKGDATVWKFADDKNEMSKLNPFLISGLDEKYAKIPIRGLAFSGDNNICATGHGDGSLIIWDLKTNTAVGKYQHKDGWINSIAASQKGDAIVSGGGDGILYLWKKDSKGKYQLTELQGHTDRIWFVALSDDGRFAASGSDDKTVRVWDLKTKKEIKCFKKHTRWVQALAFNHNTTLLASSGGDGKIFLWDIKSGKVDPIAEYLGHDDSVLSLHFSHDNKNLLSGSRDHTVRIWDVSKKYSQYKLKAHEDRITCACFSIDGLKLLTGSNDKTVRVWDTDTGKPVGEHFAIQSSVSSLQVTPDGNSFWAGCDDGSIEIWDVKTSQNIKRFSDHGSRVYSIDLSLDSKFAISADQNGKIILWLMRTFEKLFEASIDGESILSIALSPDASKAAAGMRSGNIYLWDIESGNNRSYFMNERIHKPVFESWVDGITFSTDGTKIEARGGSWNNRRIEIIHVDDLSIIKDDEQTISDGPVGSFGRYRLGFGKTELSVKSIDNLSEIAWYPKALEFAVLHPKKRQWAGVQRYNLHHFRLEGGV